MRPWRENPLFPGTRWFRNFVSISVQFGDAENGSNRKFLQENRFCRARTRYSRTKKVLKMAVASRPIPAATPIAAVSQMPAAVASPLISSSLLLLSQGIIETQTFLWIQFMMIPVSAGAGVLRPGRIVGTHDETLSFPGSRRYRLDGDFLTGRGEAKKAIIANNTDETSCVELCPETVELLPANQDQGPLTEPVRSA